MIESEHVITDPDINENDTEVVKRQRTSSWFSWTGVPALVDGLRYAVDSVASFFAGIVSPESSVQTKSDTVLSTDENSPEVSNQETIASDKGGDSDGDKAAVEAFLKDYQCDLSGSVVSDYSVAKNEVPTIAGVSCSCLTSSYLIRCSVTYSRGASSWVLRMCTEETTAYTRRETRPTSTQWAQ